MAEMKRSDFSGGWQPNHDALGCPPNALLRMDNMALDERGVLALRKGAAETTTPIFTYAGFGSACHSLYTLYMSSPYGTRKWRVFGAADKVLINVENLPLEYGGTLIHLPIDFASSTGKGDVSFAQFMDNLFMARGTNKFRADWNGPRKWGMAAPLSAPTASRLASDVKILATCDLTEAPQMTADEGTGSFATDPPGDADNAFQLISDADTLRGTCTKTFLSPEDFTVLEAGTPGHEDDEIELWVYLADPLSFTQCTLLIDVDDGSFSQNYFEYTWENRIQTVEQDRDPLLDDLDATYSERTAILDNASQAVTRQVKDNPFHKDAETWTRIAARRKLFERRGDDASKSWNTVKAVRFTFHGSAQTTVRVDYIQFRGGETRRLKGKYKYRALYVINKEPYQPRGEASEDSEIIELLNEATEVTVANPPPTEVFITDIVQQKAEIWLFRAGGLMNGYYRVATHTITSQTGNAVIQDTLSDVDALKLNIRLDLTDQNPPDDIIGLAGPYHDRLFALTATTLYPSRRLNPDSFSEDQEIPVGDESRTAYWVQQTANGLYVGTSHDILFLDGTGNELPDGTVEFTLRPLNIANPPISKAVARDGNNIFYLASDGWRYLDGYNSYPITGQVELLYRGKTRHGVDPVNISSRDARFRAAVYKNQLWCLTPEGDATGYCATVHVYDLARKQWYRFVYDLPDFLLSELNGFMSIFTQPDGSLVAGDKFGFVWQLDSGTTDRSSAIPVEIWTPADANGAPNNLKDAHDLRLHIETGNSYIDTIGVHKNGEQTVSQIISAINQPTPGVYRTALTTLGEFYQAQLRIVGQFDVFRLFDYSIFYYQHPDTRILWDTGPALGLNSELFWLRELHIKVKATANLTVTPYTDDTAATASTVVVSSGTTKVYQVKLGRGLKGTVPRVRISSSEAFTPYWVDIIGTRSGMTQERLRINA